MEKQNYGFSTAISMVVGIVIGSGIFFKADDILVAVNGNVLLGLLGFAIVGLGVLFGALTISYYATKDKEHIGMIGYARTALGPKFAFVTGWFSIACYFPALIVVLAMVASIYLGILIGVDSQLFISISTLVLLVMSFVINVKSPKLGGKLQVVFTIAKVIPLIVLGLVGALFFTDSDSISTINTTVATGGKPLTALIAIAFAFDGWIVATNISKDLRNSERDLPRALALGTLAIVSIYAIYFFGVTQILDPVTIIAAGDAHTEMAATAVLGPIGGKLITLFVVISVYGGLNGMTLAYLRMPKLMLDAKLMKNIYGQTAKQIDRGTLVFCGLGIGFYYLFQLFLDLGVLFPNLESAFDISSLPIMLNYVIYVGLFVMVNKFTAKEKTSKRVYYLLISSFAALTGLVVIYGAMQVNGLIYLLVTGLIAIVGIPFYKSQSQTKAVLNQNYVTNQK